MTDNSDLEYYAARERQARELAASATDPSIRSIHLEMAERYANMQGDTESMRPRTTGKAKVAP